MEQVDVWDIMPGEKSEDYKRFCAYRDMSHVVPGVAGETRSIRKLATQLKIQRQRLERLSTKYNWVSRAEAYDIYMADKIRRENEADIVKMRKEHATIAQQMLRKATKRLLSIPEEEMSAQDIARLVDVGVRVERLSRGEATENQRVSGEVKTTHDGEVQLRNPANVSLAGLSDEELMQLEGILDKLHPEPDV